MMSLIKSDTKLFILIGGPGSGKGTQVDILIDKFKLDSIPIGKLLREKALNDKRILMNTGDLVDVNIVNSVIAHEIKKIISKEHKGIVFDGYPRNKEQAIFLEEIIQTENLSNAEFVIFFLDTNDEILINRISGRFMCKDCGSIYNIYYSPPKNIRTNSQVDTEHLNYEDWVNKINDLGYICDQCMSENFIIREDDNRAVIKVRIENYKAQTLPLLDFYKSLNRDIYYIDASFNKDNIANEISEIANSKLKNKN